MNAPSPKPAASFTFAGGPSRFLAALSIVSSGRGHGIFEAGLVADGAALADPTDTAALAAGAGTTVGPGAAVQMGKIDGGINGRFLPPDTIMGRLGNLGKQLPIWANVDTSQIWKNITIYR